MHDSQSMGLIHTSVQEGIRKRGRSRKNGPERRVSVLSWASTRLCLGTNLLFGESLLGFKVSNLFARVYVVVAASKSTNREVAVEGRQVGSDEGRRDCPHVHRNAKDEHCGKRRMKWNL